MCRIGLQQAASKLRAPKSCCSPHEIRAHFCAPIWRRSCCRALNGQPLRGQAAASCDAPADDDYEAALDDREVSPEVAAHLRSVRDSLGKAVRGALAAPLRPDRSARVQAWTLGLGQSCKLQERKLGSLGAAKPPPSGAMLAVHM